ncbi:hypothetical protein [Dactylosporangium sp. CA-233914]
MVDWRVYLPRSWTAQPQRCAAAGIPEHIEFVTEAELGPWI